MDLKTILFIVTSHAVMGDTGEPTGVWFEELSTPYYELIDAGYKVEIASIKGGAVPIDPRSKEGEAVTASVKRFMGDKKAMALIENTPSIESIDASRYAAILLPGGHGTVWDFRNNDQLNNIIASTYEDGRIVAAVCHGPSGLLDARLSNGDALVKGKKISAFTNSEEDAVGLTDTVPYLLETELEKRGAIIHKTDDFQPFAIADGNVITGQNPASSEKVAKLMIEVLAAQE